MDLDRGIGCTEVRMAVEQPFDVRGGLCFEDRIASDMQAVPSARI